MKRKTLRICYLVLECLLEPHIWIDSHVSSLSPYTDWIREIYNSGHDWTAAVVEGATKNDIPSRRRPVTVGTMPLSWTGKLRELKEKNKRTSSVIREKIRESRPPEESFDFSWLWVT